MDALKEAKIRKELTVREIALEEKYLDRADGPAYSQSKARIVNMRKAVSELDEKIAALTEAELFKQDREAAINRAVQIKQINLLQAIVANCFAGADNEIGMTSTRYTAICNELYRALKELDA